MVQGHTGQKNGHVTRKPYRETILIVEDTPFMADVLKDIFTEDGFDTTWAKDATEALALYPAILPDIITLDIVMPGMDGIELLGHILEMDPAAKAIMVSAVGMESHVMKAISMGAKNFVVKPFDREKVLKAVHAAGSQY